jgi:hypothetical protein
MNRETEMAHCAKCMTHHDALAKCHRKMAKAHSAIADNTADQTVALHHRDLAKAHGATAESHDEMREHFEARREALANGSGATVVDAHQNSGDVLMHVAANHLLDVDGRVDLRRLVSAEF